MNDLSKISFVNADITRIRFNEDTYWGPENRFEILEERFLKASLKSLFDWNEFPLNKSEVSKVRALLKDLGIKWIEEAEFTRIDERTIKGIRPARASDPSPIRVRYHLERPTPIELHDNENTCEAFSDVAHIIEITLHKNNQIYLTVDSYLYRGPWRLFVRNEKGNLEVYSKSVSLKKIMTIYRNLRENYEYNLRYEEASEFFKREMELRRNYKEVTGEDGLNIKKNDRLHKYFSLTGLYYIVSLYGESLLRPTVFLAITIAVSSLIWLITSSPHEIQPSLNLSDIGNYIPLITAVTRTIVDIVPFIPLSGAGLGDIAVKSVGALVIGLLIIALRRKFERRFRH